MSVRESYLEVDNEDAERLVVRRRVGAGGPSAWLESEQERWFLWVPVLFGGGIWGYFALPSEPSFILTLVGTVVALVAARLLGQGARSYSVLGHGMLVVIVPAVILSVMAGFVAGKVRTELARQPILEKRLSNVRVSGVIERVEPRGESGQRVTLRVAAIAGLATRQLPRRVRLHQRRTDSRLKPGLRVAMTATLSPPPAPAYPGGYDFGRAAFFQGLGGVGFASSSFEVETGVGEAVPAWTRVQEWLAGLRQEIGRRVMVALPGQAGAIANALITGQRGQISADTNAAFRDSGLAHILAISGLHMTIMAGFVFLSVRIMLAAIPAIALRYPTKKWAAVFAAVAALAYLLISGGSHATLRAWLMMSIMFLAVLLDRPAISMRNVALAALAILVVMPESLFDVGFQMSFAAVTGLVAAYEVLRRRREEQLANVRRQRRGALVSGWVFFGGIVLASVVASVAVAPFAAFHFHKSQQFAVLANLVAVPICNFLVMPMALLSLIAMPLGLEAGPLWLMGVGIEWMTGAARWVSSLPGAVTLIPQIPTSSFGLMVLGGLWLTLWLQRWRLLGVAVIAGGVALAPMHRHPDVLVGRDGGLVAVRGADGLLGATGARGSRYELERWLENDGDGRSPAAVLASGAFRCDPVGCVATVKGRLVAVARHPAAFRDDCAAGAVVVAAFAGAHGCRVRGVLIDRQAVDREGTHAVYIGDTIVVETVAKLRGRRPWSSP